MPSTENDDDDDDLPSLPLDSLALVHDILQPSAYREESEGLLDDGDEFSMTRFGEDWNASQFWYDDETSELLARVILARTTPSCRVALISAPSIYVKLKSLTAGQSVCPLPRLFLFEFDKRFQVFEDFVPYDYKHPLAFSSYFKDSFDVLLIDPPFLSDECQSSTAKTVHALARRNMTDPTRLGQWDARVIVCTGERMKDVVLREYESDGVRMTDFSPVHKNGLANEFACYANFECEDWQFQRPDTKF